MASISNKIELPVWGGRGVGKGQGALCLSREAPNFPKHSEAGVRGYGGV